MSDINSVIKKIINLGKENDWFIPLDLVTESDFIFAKGNIITIDTSGFTLFINADKNNLPELEEQLREMIEVEVPESEDYTILIDLKDSYI